MQIFNHGINKIHLLFVLNIDFVDNLSVSSGFTDEEYQLLQFYTDTPDFEYFFLS